MGDLLRSPRDRVSYLAYPNLFGTKGFVKVKVKVLIDVVHSLCLGFGTKHI